MAYIFVSDAGEYENLPQTFAQPEPAPCIVLKRILAKGKEKEKRLFKVRRSQAKSKNTNDRTTLEDVVNILTQEDKKETKPNSIGVCKANDISTNVKPQTGNKERGQSCNKDLLDGEDMDLLFGYRKDKDKQSEKTSLWSAMSSGAW